MNSENHSKINGKENFSSPSSKKIKNNISLRIETTESKVTKKKINNWRYLYLKKRKKHLTWINSFSKYEKNGVGLLQF